VRGGEKERWKSGEYYKITTQLDDKWISRYICVCIYENSTKKFNKTSFGGGKE
jgi:hypothetical protein